MTMENEIDAGIEETMAFLYEKLGRPALSKTLRIVHQQSLAEEITHDVFITMWQNKMVFPNLRHAYAWVYRCCTNKAIDVLRSKSQQNISLEITESILGSDDKTQQSLEAKEAVKSLLTSMNDREAAILVYQYVEGLKQEEIAEVMGVSRSTVVRVQDKVSMKIKKFKDRQNDR